MQPAFEDPLARLLAEVSEPAGPRPTFDPEQPEPQLVGDLDQAETEPAAWVLPLAPAWFGEGWASPAWRTRRGRLVLIPGDSPAGARLPLDALSWKDPDFAGEESYTRAGPSLSEADGHPRAVVVDPDDAPTRTALVVEARDCFVHVFLPPLERLEKFIELVGLVDRAAAETGTAVILEGYGPPPDSRIKTLLITPDPGVIEVNVHPTSSWAELSDLIQTLYRTRPRATALRRDLRVRRAAQWYGRRQPPDTWRPRADAIAVAPAAGSAGKHDHLLAAPSRAVVPLLRTFRGTDQPGAARR